MIEYPPQTMIAHRNNYLSANVLILIMDQAQNDLHILKQCGQAQTSYKLYRCNSYMQVILCLICKQDSIRLPMNKQFYGLSRDGKSGKCMQCYDTHKKRLHRGLIPLYNIFCQYSFNILNQAHLWSSRKFKQVYNMRAHNPDNIN